MREPVAPISLERSRVPEFFPQFRNAAALAHLANKGRGPRYVLVGGRAWYDQADILAWLESNKRSGPKIECKTTAEQPKQLPQPRRGRGRPTKMQQSLRRCALVPAGNSV
jgi:hypothetical protein